MSSHSNQQQYYCNSGVLKCCYFFFLVTMGDFTHTLIIANRMAEYHQKELKKFCRVCGERISRNRVSFSCQQHADNIAQTFELFCRDDNPDVHPPVICHGCFSIMTRSKKAAEEGKQYHHSVKTFSWTSHSPDECTVCEHFEKVISGGRPKKIRRKPCRPAIKIPGVLLTTSIPLLHPLSSLQMTHLQGK